jgi:phospholipid/cholesterol/gamma-HCH transport system substrate-binding protein
MTRALHDDSTAYRFGNIVSRLDSTVLLVKQVALRMESQEGTVGKLLGDRQLYDRLLKTTAGLDSLITDIKANPKKYVHVSVF